MKCAKCAAAILTVAALGGGSLLPASAARSGDWATYLGANERSGANAAETTITSATAPRLRSHWTATTGGAVVAQPVVVNGLVYTGSWDGYERATSLSGKLVWKTYLGQSKATCTGTVGVTSTPTVVTQTTPGVSVSTLYVGGGDGQLYALDAGSGVVLWHTPLGTPPATYLWGSPAVYNGNVYMGVSSMGDCPLVQGQLAELSAATGAVEHVFDVVPNGCLGGSIWSSPAINTTSGTVFVTTGNTGPCSNPEPYAQAVVALRASDLSPLRAWQVPVAQTVTDSDFGATPTLFTANIGGRLRQMVGVANKNGIYYAFDQNALGSGPIWQDAIANGGEDPDAGDGSIAPSAFDGRILYVAGGHAAIGNNWCLGSLRAVNPATGTYLWQDCIYSGPVLGGVTVAGGVAVVEAGYKTIVVATSTGKRLFTQRGPANVEGATSISNGVLYEGDMKGSVYALTPS